ncbi:MAG: hypothetical protein QOG81_1713 [Gaiellaceae bacterium]|nr:hypothetical protein [Gaiellaceae bacterium]
MDVLLAFGAALLTLRLAGALLGRWRARRAPELAAWAASLLCYSVASAALAWGAAHGWDGRAFRVYYLFGGLLTAPLLGVGSLLLAGRRWALPIGLLYAGLAVGVAVSVPLHGAIGGTAVPHAQDALAFVPARLCAVLANSLGTIAVVAVAVSSLRRRPLGNALILLGVGLAAVGTAAGGLGIGGSAVFIALAACALYAGFVARPGSLRLRRAQTAVS